MLIRDVLAYSGIAMEVPVLQPINLAHLLHRLSKTFRQLSLLLAPAWMLEICPTFAGLPTI